MSLFLPVFAISVRSHLVAGQVYVKSRLILLRLKGARLMVGKQRLRNAVSTTHGLPAGLLFLAACSMILAG